MKAVKPGFEDYKAPQILLEFSRESSQNITLKVGSVMEEVDVVAKGTARPCPQKARKTGTIRLGGDIQAPKLLNKVQRSILQRRKPQASRYGNLACHHRDGGQSAVSAGHEWPDRS